MKMKYIGKENPYFGEGIFTVEKSYQVFEKTRKCHEVPSYVKVIDDEDFFMFEDIDSFEEIDDNDDH